VFGPPVSRGAGMPRFAGLALTRELEAEVMVNNSSLASEEWLTREDNVCRQDRLARLN